VPHDVAGCSNVLPELSEGGTSISRLSPIAKRDESCLLRGYKKASFPRISKTAHINSEMRSNTTLRDIKTPTKEDLRAYTPRHSAFVGIDSDGCIFPTMEIKQKKCFHPLIIVHWGLEKIEAYVRETAEFVNLYSKWRGTNRFVALDLTFRLLRERPEVRAAGVRIPELRSLRRFIDSGAPLGNSALKAAVHCTNNRELATVLRWSEAVNAKIAETVKHVPPFQGVVPSLEKIRAHADAICVSQTPTEALVREWEEHNLVGYVAFIAGQELGSKAEQIALAAGGKYAPDRIMMIGDALGDLNAATANNAFFYPICPGREEASWQRFHAEAFDRFLKGSFQGRYAEGLIAEFQALLPETPPWQRCRNQRAAK